MARKATLLQGAPRASLHFHDSYGLDVGPNNVVWRYVWCAGYDEVDAVDESGRPYKKKEFHHFTNKKCECPPGPQVLALRSTAFETTLGGGRGALKTETGFAFSVKGNAVPNPTDPTDIAYINNKRYRFLVLRKNSKDLGDWFRRAREFYAPFGATFTENPMRIKFPSGAEGILDHMEDENAYEKYMGQEFQRILTEELTQIPSENLYKKIIMSCRSTVPGLKPQVFNTANPGGPGAIWFNKRFVDLKDKEGNTIKPGTLWVNPETGLSRLFIHCTVYDNPYFLRDNSMYVRTLEELDGVERMRWLYGDFHVMEGQYFSMFRPKRLEGEPENACHVVPDGSIQLMPWWHRWIGMDWGYRHHSAIYWACQHPNGQVFIYRELVVSGIGESELGAEIARRSLPDLNGLENHSMTLWLSPEQWGKKGESKPTAQLLADGMRRVLGNDAVYIPDKADAPTVNDFFGRLRFQGKAGLSIRPAQSQRISGWQYCRELMRWKQAIPPNQDKFDQQYWIHLCETEGFEKGEQYRLAFEARKPEVLPKLQILDCCPMLIESIPKAQYDDDLEDVMKTNTIHDDINDAFRYLCAAHEYQVNKEPLSAAVARHMAPIDSQHPNMNPNSRIWAIRKAEEDWRAEQEANQPFFIPRSGVALRHMVQ